MRFDSSVAKERDRIDRYVVEIRSIEIRTLAQVLEEYLPPTKCIDFMSVDVEGFDLPVLRSNDWYQFRPEFVLAEDLSCEGVEDALKTPIATFLRSVGYVLFARTAHTGVYRRR